MSNFDCREDWPCKARQVLFAFFFSFFFSIYIIILKPGPSRRVNLGPGRPRAGTGRVEEKIGEGKTRCDPARPDQKPGCNLLIFIYFYFFTKTTSF